MPLRQQDAPDSLTERPGAPFPWLAVLPADHLLALLRVGEKALLYSQAGAGDDAKPHGLLEGLPHVLV
jgi:hypothetical protein